MKALRRACTCAAAALLLAPAWIHAQESYPTKAIEIMVPWGPGGGADLLGRIVGRWLETDLKAAAPVLNQPGAMGTVGFAKMVAAPADAQMIGVLTTETLMQSSVGPSQVKPADYHAVGIMVRQPTGMFARADGRFRRWEDVVKEAKAKPGTVTVAITGPNSPDDLFIKYLAGKGIELVGVAYAKPAERYAAVLGKHVDLLCEQAGDIRAHLDGKMMSPLVFFTPQRLAAPFADVPAGAEYGYDIFLQQFRAIVVRTGTEPARLRALGASLERFSKTDAYAGYLRDQYALPDSFVGLERADALVRSELAQMRKVLDALGTR